MELQPRTRPIGTRAASRLTGVDAGVERVHISAIHVDVARRLGRGSRGHAGQPRRRWPHPAARMGHDGRRDRPAIGTRRSAVRRDAGGRRRAGGSTDGRAGRSLERRPSRRPDILRESPVARPERGGLSARDVRDRRDRQRHGAGKGRSRGSRRDGAGGVYGSAGARGRHPRRARDPLVPVLLGGSRRSFDVEHLAPVRSGCTGCRMGRALRSSRSSSGSGRGRGPWSR